MNVFPSSANAEVIVNNHNVFFFPLGHPNTFKTDANGKGTKQTLLPLGEDTKVPHECAVDGMQVTGTNPLLHPLQKQNTP